MRHSSVASPTRPTAYHIHTFGTRPVVEDEPFLQRRLHAVLQSLGYESDAVRSAPSVTKAREMLAQMPVALALIDPGLPTWLGTQRQRGICRGRTRPRRLLQLKNLRIFGL